MNLPTMTMSRAEARQHFLEYKRAIGERHDSELAEIMAGYKQMALGRQVLSLRQAVADGGTVKVVDQVYEHGYGQKDVDRILPALACCRADAAECWVRHTPSAVHFGTTERAAGGWGRFRAADHIRLGNPFDGKRSDTRGFKAMVPIVPPALRPRTHLRNFHILWEAKWTRNKPLAPEDPALLKRVGQDLFVVLAVWDLTPLERAVLGARG